MTATAAKLDEIQDSSAQLTLFQRACEGIAPTWPLDQMIAVNPFWELRHLSASEVAARVAALADANTLMPAAYYAQLDNPVIEDRHLLAAAARIGFAGDLQSLRSDLADQLTGAHLCTVSNLLDRERDPHQMAWQDEIIHQVSQFCAASFQAQSAASEELGAGTKLAGGQLYKKWLDTTRADRGIPILMGEPALRARFQELPDSLDELLLTASAELGIQEGAAELYAHGLLLDINGWASWIAYLRWQERLAGGDSDLMQDLLGIRLGWELALWRLTAESDSAAFRRLQSSWLMQLAAPAAIIVEHRNAQRKQWVWQAAAELAYQEHLCGRVAAGCVQGSSALTAERSAPASLSTVLDAPVLQAVFCIDVRSEVIRRHLEAQHPGIQTRGFAGFFGLPIDYQPAGTDFQRPQLPGLLAPALRVTSAEDQDSLARTRARTRWNRLGEASPAMFSLVEASGPFYGLKLLKDSFLPAETRHPVNHAGGRQALEIGDEDGPLSVEARTELVAGVLHAMGLEKDFAPVVMLVGHGSSSANNPHAASLDCGACGGQTGELNARMLASLLNNKQVREGLAAKGVKVPDSTQFVAALHDTTTDRIGILDEAVLTPQITSWLDCAGNGARRERAARLGLSEESDGKLAGILKTRSRDWSQVRPEWGLADNAAFIVAPRRRTRGIDLEGRVFLHDYDWSRDPDYAVLELIMTAPMIVTHWINMQYNASVADNQRFGSGNKVLHNVVGGNIGVFEGNGGDLRIGLPFQSLNDGQRWLHTPLRISVFIEAPEDAIKAIYGRHEVVSQLVDNDWLYLYSLGANGRVARLYRGDWLAPEWQQ